MQVRSVVIIVISLFFSELHSVPIEIEVLSGRIFLVSDAHEHLFVANDEKMHEARCAWADGCFEILGAEDATYSVVIEDMEHTRKMKKPLLSGDISINKLKKLVHEKNGGLNSFLLALGCLGLDSRLTAPHVELLNMTSPIGVFVDELAPLLDELREYVQANRQYLWGFKNRLVEAAESFINGFSRTLGFARHQNNLQASYTLDWLLRELSILRNYYKKILEIGKKKGSDKKFETLEANFKILNNHIGKVHGFFKDNKSSENMYLPLYDIFKENLVKTDPQAEENIRRLREILFYSDDKSDLDSCPYFLSCDLDVQVINAILASDPKTIWILFMGHLHVKEISNYLKNCGFTGKVIEQGFLQVGSSRYTADEVTVAHVWEKIQREVAAGTTPMLIPCSFPRFLGKFKEYQDLANE